VPVFDDKVDHRAKDQNRGDAGQPENYVKDKVDLVAEVGNIAGQPPDTGLPDFGATRGTPQPENSYEP
jgi:hypothetical protein